MERLKSLSEVFEPDIRYRGRVDLDKATEMVSETTSDRFTPLFNLTPQLCLPTRRSIEQLKGSNYDRES